MQGGTFLAGEFNAHSTQWDPRCQVQQNATFWGDLIEEIGLEIGNEGGATHHWIREVHEGKSVIDLTLANRPITKLSILSDDHTMGSDHYVIEWEVDADRDVEADNQWVVGWHLAAMTKEEAMNGATESTCSPGVEINRVRIEILN